VRPCESLEELRRNQLEFNVTMEIEILQAAAGDAKEKRVGQCTATFHVAPKALLRARQVRFRNKRAKRTELEA
jgi:hypothetical protein